MVDQQTARLWAQVRAQVKRIDAEHAAKTQLQQPANFTERYHELIRTHPAVVNAVMSYLRRVAGAQSPVQPRPSPHNRAELPETARVTCLGWHNPRALNRWVHERNLFWHALQGRHNVD